MSVKIEDIKPGDTVVLRVQVMSVGDGMMSVGSKTMGAWLVPAHIVVEHVPAPREIRVGDMVRTIAGTPRRVHAIYGEKAWLEGDFIYSLCSLRHAD